MVSLHLNSTARAGVILFPCANTMWYILHFADKKQSNTRFLNPKQTIL